MNLMTILSIALLSVFFSTNANSALIDNGSYTTDDVTGLDWLDISVTAGQTYNSVLDLNPGWRYATNSEVEALHATLFENFVPTTSYGSVDSRYGTYDGMSEDIAKMESLFGTTSSISWATYAYGMYEDELGRIMIFGTRRYYEPGDVAFDTIWGLDYPYADPGWEDLRFIEGAWVGSMLVRTSVVPIPAAVWLFGSGLLSLIGIALRGKTVKNIS